MSKNLDELLQEAPSLTFEPFAATAETKEEVIVVEEAKKELQTVESRLTPEEQKIIERKMKGIKENENE